MDAYKFSARDREISNHYAHFLGEPSRNISFKNKIKGAPSPIIIFEWAPTSEGENWIYATLGASRQPMAYPDNWPGQKSERRMELMLYSNRRNDELFENLDALAQYPFGLKTFLAAGHTIHGDRGIIHNSPLTNIVISTPSPQEFAVVHHTDNSHTLILAVLPVYPAERLFVRQHDMGALLELFEKRQVNHADFSRMSVI